MIQFQQYVGRVNGLRGTFGGLPPWARSIVSIFAIPGLLLMALSVVVFVVSILALLLLTLPVYSLLQRLTGSANGGSGGVSVSPLGTPFGAMFSAAAPGNAKRVDATVIDSETV